MNGEWWNAGNWRELASIAAYEPLLRAIMALREERDELKAAVDAFREALVRQDKRATALHRRAQAAESEAIAVPRRFEGALELALKECRTENCELRAKVAKLGEQAEDERLEAMEEYPE